MKKVFKILILIFIIWMGVSYYFLTEHSFKGKEAKINQTITFDDFSIELDRLVVFNVERNRTDFLSESNKSKYMLANSLPQPLFYPYLYFIHFYSSPYIVDDKLYHTSLVGKVIFKDDKLHGSQGYFDYIRDHIRINVSDHIGYGYSSGTALQYEDNHTYVDIIVRGQNFPIDRLQQGLKVTVKYLDSGEEREILIKSHDFRNYEYNDAFGRITSLNTLIR